MYFKKEAQARILSNFHFALRGGGFLFLGKSEMMLARSDLFHPVDMKRRVFQKTARDRHFELPPRPLPEPRRERITATEQMMHDVGFETAPVAQLVIDSDGTLILANLQARTLFGLSQRDVGRPLKDLDVSYKPVELRSQLDRVYAEQHSITVSDVQWSPAGGGTMVMDVQLVPLVSADSDVFGVGISFVDVTRFRRLQEAFEQSKHDTETAYEELQSTVEEMETTNEELQSTNEELETTNEELQSTNEELETMNEELSSTNEELEAINDELQQRTEELNETNVFLAAILGSFDGGVVLLDGEMRVTAWNAGARDLWGLDDNQVQGQHFLNLDIGLPVDELRPAVRAALAGNGDREAIEIEARGRNGHTMRCLVRLSPLVPDGGSARGVILFLEPIPE
jgi:two-component system, chemotaxis family, CheB/CheR fusion protein